MKIAVYYPDKFPAYSLKIYTDKVIKILENKDIKFVKFNSKDNIPNNADIYWDSQTGGGNPVVFNRKLEKPTIMTMNGAALYSLPIKDNFHRYKTIIGLIKKRKKFNIIWKKKSKFVDFVISVSKFSKYEVLNYFPFQENQTSLIYYGVDFDYFKLEKKEYSNQKKFLHISQYQPKKNIQRLIAGFELACKERDDLELTIICPGYPKTINNEKIKLITEYADRETVKKYLHNSYAFIFPSLHETFGFPILEAMASSLPVITAKTTACGEVANNSAILVDPYSKTEISQAIINISENEKLYYELINNGLINAKNFTWEKCAYNHLQVFENSINKYNEKT